MLSLASLLLFSVVDLLSHECAKLVKLKSSSIICTTPALERELYFQQIDMYVKKHLTKDNN